MTLDLEKYHGSTWHLVFYMGQEGLTWDLEIFQGSGGVNLEHGKISRVKRGRPWVDPTRWTSLSAKQGIKLITVSAQIEGHS